MPGPAGKAAALILPVLLAACDPAAAPSSGTAGNVPLGDYQLLRMGGQDVEGAHVTLLIDAGKVSGGGFCNRYHGAQTADLPALSIGPLASTMMACGGNRMEQDITYLKALEGATRASFAGDRLTVTGSGPDLVFEPHQPD